MKQRVSVGACLILLALLVGSQSSASVAPQSEPQAPRTLPDVIILAKENKMGPVTFNHADHATKNHNIAGTGPIACVDCHHTAQPASEVAKHPTLKTAWPADRTTTLTLDLLTKNPDGVGLIACRNCHARSGAKPITWPEIPTVKHEDSAAILTLTNQLAFHRTCGGCHEEAAKNRQNLKAPQPQKCNQCHKH